MQSGIASTSASSRHPGRRPANLAMRLLIGIFLCSFVSCGGGTSPIQTVPPPPPDFSVSTQPTSLLIAAGASQSVQVSVTGINGFSASVQVTATLPSGLTALPSSFSLSIGTPQQVMISAGASAANGSATVTFTAVSGSLMHTAQ